MERIEAQRSGAAMSLDGVHRYRLDRVLAPLAPEPAVLWVMLNPSTADATADDPTIRRVAAFSRRERFGRIIVCNLHSLRATDPRQLIANVEDYQSPDEVEADRHMLAAAREAHTIVVAWGSHGARWPQRVKRVYNLLASSGGGAVPARRRAARVVRRAPRPRACPVTPAALDVARRLAAHPRWEWRAGVRALGHGYGPWTPTGKGDPRADGARVAIHR